MKKAFGVLFLSLICAPLWSLPITNALQPANNNPFIAYLTQQMTPEIHCGASIPIEATNIFPSFILNWAAHAVNQSFEFNVDALDKQLQQLEACYSEKGWNEFNMALQRSGNLDIIKHQRFRVRSQLDGQAHLIESTHDSFWKVNLPLKVIYQNNEQRITHFLNVYLTIGRKIKGELAIMQLIATPRLPPLTQKKGSIEETARSIYAILAKRNSETFNTTQNKIIAPFFASLLPTETRIISSFLKPISDKLERPLDLREKPRSSGTRNPSSIAGIMPQTPLAPLPSPILFTAAKISRTLNAEKQALMFNAAINCEYVIPAKIAHIDQTLILDWAKQAASQSFDFHHAHIDRQLQKLQACYTEEGWREFKTALEHSGNINAIKSQKLIMHSQMVGQPELIESKENQWSIILPLKVVYQTDRNEKVTQFLQIHLTIGRKMTGALGIIHIIATLGVA